MSLRFVVQRDMDGTWSVRLAGSNDVVSVHGSPQLGLTEDLAVIRAKKLNDFLIEADGPARETTAQSDENSHQADAEALQA